MTTPEVPFLIEDEDERRRAIALVADLQAFRPAPCPVCERDLCGHHYVISVAMGFKSTPRCVSCLGEALAIVPQGLLERARRFIRERPCFQAGWEWANQNEQPDNGDFPACVVNGLTGGVVAHDAAESEAGGRSSTPASTWDAGDLSCGDLVLELRLRLQKLNPGQILALGATDPAAPEDIPAWCRLTGHKLVDADPPRYLIRRKD